MTRCSEGASPAHGKNSAGSKNTTTTSSWSGDPNAARLAIASVATLFGLYLLVAIAQRIALFADGSFQFLQTLLDPRLLALLRGETSRVDAAANLVSRLPLLVALRLGLTAIEPLQLIFGLGMFAHFAAMLWICTTAAAGRRLLLFFPLASFFLVSANSSFFVWSASHVMVSVFWSLLFVLVVPTRWSGRWLALALLLAIIAMESYESMVVLGVILAAAAVWRAWSEGPGLLRCGALVVAALCLFGVVIAANAILHKSVGHFARSPFPFFDYAGRPHGTALLSLAAAGLIATAQLEWRRTWRVATTGLTLACVAWLVACILRPALISVSVQHEARTLNLSLTCVLAGLFFHALLTEQRWTRNASLRAWRVLVVVAFTQTVWLILLGAHWQNYLQLVEREASTGSGIRPYEATILREAEVEGRPVSAFTWAWTLPTLSLLSARNGQVRALVAAPLWYKDWQPFSPTDVSGLPSLQRYGFRYGDYAAALSAAQR